MNFLKLLVVFVCFLLSSCSSSTPPTDESSPSVKKGSAECYIDLVQSFHGRCEYLKVKASPSDSSDNRYINVYYSFIPSINTSSKKEPIVFLIGGPGPGATFSIEDVLSGAHQQLLIDHDYVFVDYRGTGFSRPFPTCSDLDAQDVANIASKINICVANLDKDIKLSDYTSHNIAYDIHKILEKENIPKANLFGISYGTRVAMTMARDYPARINKIVLDGVFSIEANGLSQAKESILAKLDIVRQIYNSVYVREDFDTRLNAYLRDTKNTKSIQDIALRAYTDKPEVYAYDLFHDASSTSRHIDPKFNVFANSSIFAYSIIIYEELSFVDKQPLNKFGFSQLVIDGLDGFEGGAPVPISSLVNFKFNIDKAPSIEMEPVVTDVPVLMLSAGLDVQTPVHWAQKSQKYLVNSKHFFFPDQDHAFSLENTKAVELASSFLSTFDIDTLDSVKSDEFIQLK